MKNIYHIKHISIDFDDFKVTSNGVDMSLDHKAVEVIKLMVENSGSTVSNDTFMDTIWANKPSAPEVIPAAIARLRKLFKLAGISDELIVTVHKVGYRFEPLKTETIQTEANTSYKRPLIPKSIRFLLALLCLALIASLAYNYKQSSVTPKQMKSIKQSSSQGEVQIRAESDSDVTQIYILRHTEKADDISENPLLSPKGVEHAKYWKKVLQHTEFDQVFTTDFKRNIQTAELLSTSTSVNPELYYPMSFDVLKFIEQIQGETVLIIGHSNTIPDMVNRLIDETKYPPMSHKNYNVLYIVNINKNGDTSSTALHIEMP